MAATDVVSVYQVTKKGETLAIVIPKRFHKQLGLKKGIRLRATVNSKNQLVYRLSR